MTDRQRILKALVELGTQGYFAQADWCCCQNCGWSEVPDEYANKAIFYHAQDADSLDKEGNLIRPLHFAWSGNGQEIVAALEKQGFTVDWNGSEDTRIAILPDEA